MRSMFVLGAVAIGLMLLVAKGYLPRRAGATVNSADAVSAGRGGGVETRYADYEAPQPAQAAPRAHDRQPARPHHQTQPAREAVAPPQAALERPAGKAHADDTGGRKSQPDDSKQVVPPPADEQPKPVADAGPDQTVWIGRNELALDGGRSTGAGLTYAWRQVSGPRELTIAKPSAATTTATGLSDLTAATDWKDAIYELELTVTDAHGRQTSDKVRYTVRKTPALSIRPRAETRLAYRDGYLMAHYAAWKTNQADYTETFELRSPQPLFIQQLAGDTDYEIAISEAGEHYVYRVSVFCRQGRPTTSMEFFVDTAERIPAIVQLGVTWE